MGYQIEMILLNAGHLQFTVNIFGFHMGNIYPIHIGIGASASSQKNLQVKTVNIFRINLYKDDFYQNIDIETADVLLEQWLNHKNNILNRDETEKIKKQILQ